MINRCLLAWLTAGHAIAMNAGAYAQPGTATKAMTGTEAQSPSPVPSPFGDIPAVDGSALQAVTGMANLQQYASANNSSVVAGNSVNGESVTGQIAIDGQSFQNMHGLSILTANTGNNVSINAAMNVNVSIQQ